MIESIEKNIHGAWDSNLIFIGYKNIDFEQDDLREVRDVLAVSPVRVQSMAH